MSSSTTIPPVPSSQPFTLGRLLSSVMPVVSLVPVVPEALALARIGFGAVLFASLVDPLRNAPAFYSDQGFLPRSKMFDLVRSSHYSIFDASGVPAVATLLVVAAMVAALAFTVGYRTRLATFASFVLVSGLAERNLYVCDGHDTVNRVMLAWFLFVPMGARYSVDAVLRRRQGLPPEACRWRLPAVLAQFQVAWVYFDACLSKLQVPAWRSGTAVGEVLFSHAARPLGVTLRDVAPFVRWATYGTLAFEGLFLLLVISPLATVALRRIAVASAVAFHLAAAPFLHVGWLPAVMVPLLALYLDAPLAQKIARFLHLDRLERGAASAPPWPDSTPVSRPFFAAALVTVAVCVVWTSLPKELVEGTALEAPPSVSWAVESLELWQSWDMFAPVRPEASMTLVAHGHTRAGALVNVLAGRDDSHGALIPVRDPRWARVRESLVAENSPYLLEFGRFLCRQWNDEVPHEKSDDLMTFTMVRRTETRDGTNEHAIWQHQCFDLRADEAKPAAVAVNVLPHAEEPTSHL
jgi:hypothetical protein